MAQTAQQQQLLTMLQHYQGSDQYQTLIKYIDQSPDYETASDLHAEIVGYINKTRLNKKLSWREQGELLEEYITMLWNMIELHITIAKNLDLDFDVYRCEEI